MMGWKKCNFEVPQILFCQQIFPCFGKVYETSAAGQLFF